MYLRKLTFGLLLTLTTVTASAEPNWPMAGGPKGRWTVKGPQPPLKFSVRANHNIHWKTTLPEGGQSGIAVYNNLVFLSILKPWNPKHDPNALKAQLEDILQRKAVILDTVDKDILKSNITFATLQSTYQSHDDQIEELITKRVDMLLTENANQNIAKLRERVRRFHPKVKELEAKQRQLTNQMNRIRISHSEDYAVIEKTKSDIELKIRALPSLKTTDIVAYCLDANNGEVRWSVPLTGSVEGPYNYGFSDSSSPTPITDGNYVWFVNASGSMGCWTVNGKRIWFREWTPSAKAPFNKQYEPIITGDWILNVEPLPNDDPRKSQEGDRKWNYLRAINKKTGVTEWISEHAITHYNTPIPGTLNGKPYILQGRGGPHEVPERPNGLSLTKLFGDDAGKTLWHWDPQEKVPFGALANQHWDERYAYWLKTGHLKLTVLESKTGKPVYEHDLLTNATTTLWNKDKKQYQTTSNQTIRGVVDLRHTNIVAREHFYFLIRDKWQVARVHVETGKAEYLELPSQIQSATAGSNGWIFAEVQVNDTRNSRGYDVAQDPRIKLGGFTKSFLGAPTVVNDRIYFTSMTGLVYVLDAMAKKLDHSAILSVNDLGPPGETWTVNSLTYANGKLYHRTMKEVICIGTAP
ncbi:MAG: hypothetical protein CMJ76_08195 [Planctomycetaceae bacterium]|nr:hypothetical protein [Planctomycetaceae bacterium]